MGWFRLTKRKGWKSIEKIKLALNKLGVNYESPSSNGGDSSSKVEDLLIQQLEQKDSVIKTLQNQLNIMQHMYSQQTGYSVGKGKDNNFTQKSDFAPRGKQIFLSSQKIA